MFCSTNLLSIATNSSYSYQSSWQHFSTAIYFFGYFISSALTSSPSNPTHLSSSSTCLTHTYISSFCFPSHCSISPVFCLNFFTLLFGCFLEFIASSILIVKVFVVRIMLIVLILMRRRIVIVTEFILLLNCLFITMIF